jgi:uncharacterized protein YqgC (DUF456 family)
MTTEQIIGLTLALLIMGIGALGSLLQIWPGTTLVLLAAIVHKLWFGATGVHGWIMALLVLLVLFSIALDYLATMIGARKFGASRRGMIGAIAGMVGGVVIGFLFGGVGSLVGIFIGPLVGAALMERTAARPWPEAWRAGLGATLGMLAGAVGKLMISLMMMSIFTANVVLRSWK